MNVSRIRGEKEPAPDAVANMRHELVGAAVVLMHNALGKDPHNGEKVVFQSDLAPLMGGLDLAATALQGSGAIEDAVDISEVTDRTIIDFPRGGHVAVQAAAETGAFEQAA